ncbi:MAG TPA: hypothetical protein PLL20_11600 [Phycisphaerae bacterium]|nr:hypothetical protein [Phycisphaerae bacterium]HRR84249.1 hypothetical protein [Phycisphaerae bacterium]
MTHVEALPVGISCFGIFLLIALAGLVVLILGNRGARRVLAGLAIGVAVVVVFGLLAMFWGRSSVHYSTSSPTLFSEAVYPPEDEAMESHAVRGVTIGSNGVVVREGSSSIVVNGNGVSVTDEWIDAGQADFEADVYPSERSAAVALARKAIKSWDRVLPGGQEPTQILIRGDSELEPAVVPAVLQALRAKLGDDRVEMDKSPQEAQIEEVERVLVSPGSAPSLPEADATVRLAINGNFSYVHGGRGVIPSQKRNGTIELVLSGPAGKSTHTAAFVNKPWVEYGIDRAAQVSGRQPMVARSKRLCPTRGEAEQQAIAEAAKNLVPLVRTALERLESSGASQSNRGAIAIQQRRPDPELYEKIRAELLRGTGVDDQFTQHIHRPYGDVWQHALLVDGSDGQITAYAQTFLPQIVQQQKTALRIRKSWARTIVGLALLTVLIAVVYAFLNAATRGYYTWLLRGSMVLLVLGGAVVLLLMT